MSALIQSWENPTSSKRNAIVFANRNQSYGAYDIREHYDQSLTKAFVITCTLLALLIVIPTISKLFAGQQQLIAPTKEVVIDLTDQQLIKQEVLPELPKHQVASLPSTFRFVIPKATDDLISDEPPVQNPDNNLNPGMSNNLSDSGFEDVLSPADTFETTNIPFDLANVQEIPSFQGGFSSMTNFLISNLHFPAAAREASIHGTVYISFLIDKEGNIKDANVMRGIGGGCDEEALRVVNKMPIWIAGKQNGRAVMVKMILPVQFSLR